MRAGVSFISIDPNGKGGDKLLSVEKLSFKNGCSEIGFPVEKEELLIALEPE